MSSLYFLVHYFQPFFLPPVHRFHSIMTLDIAGPAHVLYVGHNHKQTFCLWRRDPSHMLLSLVAEPTHDIFPRFMGLHCADPRQVVAPVAQRPLGKHQGDAPYRIELRLLCLTISGLFVKPFAQ